jgi:hypothetical protein
MSVARLPQLGSKPVVLTVKLKASKDANDDLSKGLQELFRMGHLTDVVLVCAQQSFPAHRAVLASQSRIFKDAFEGLAAQPSPGPNTRQEVRLEIANPEAVKIMLNHLYGLDTDDMATFNPRTQAINRDVLQLAAQFELPGLTQHAMHWLGKDLTTGNLVERLSICEEFGLSELSEKILEQLTYNKAALHEVAHGPQIMNYPKLMQEILKCAAKPEADPGSARAPKNKRVRRS